MLDKVTSQRNFIKASKLNKILENAQRHLAMGEIDAADQAFIEALGLDAANALAQEGIKSVAIWRQRRAKSDVLLAQFRTAIKAEDIARSQNILAELQQHDPTYPPIAQAIAQEAELSATLEVRAKDAADRAAAAAKAQAEADLREQIANAVQAATNLTTVSPWNRQTAQAAEAAIQQLANIDANNPSIAELQTRVMKRSGRYTAELFLSELDTVLVTKSREKMSSLIKDKQYLAALIELSEDPDFLFSHKVMAITLNEQGAISTADVEIHHALSMMPAIKLNYTYTLQRDDDVWYIAKAQALIP